ncbi:Wrky transcription factor [Thalictrum thalictroides]|uniref:Wrky transcription factor n=1 Tax=Thalictrum thalictroides TaxID=46969 RepID=A0A7J6WLY6_THATH|nr:Wrky transcription factor [Thalictrum thalictroides]
MGNWKEFDEEQMIASSLSSGILDMWNTSDYCDKTSLGFMDLLASHDFDHASFLFNSQSQSPQQPSSVFEPTLPSTTTSTLVETSEVLNLPATPNSSSISSPWAEHTSDGGQANKLVVKDEEEEEEEKEELQKSKKQLKPQKKYQKRQKERRFAFVTKSEVDHLEDGYRWRKYGQKAVKNSPFPRSYYRCTNTTCGVKKRVERSSEDSTLVVTTYEGQHTHMNPVMPRGGVHSGYQANATTFDMPVQISTQHNQLQQYPYLQSLQPAFNMDSSFVHNRGFQASRIEDFGLLQDMVPRVRIEE